MLHIDLQFANQYATLKDNGGVSLLLSSRFMIIKSNKLK